jgi:tripartite-type tricarboxylate transporter receptor subunit TctC
MLFMKPLRLFAGALLAVALNAAPAAAQDSVAAFYQGKQVTIVIGSSVGGVYDLYGRLMARHMGKHIPGNPRVIPTNMPGAGSHVAAAHIYNIAPKDGTVIGALQSTMVFEPLLAARSFNHDPTKFNYLGSANDDVYVCIARADAAVKSFKDLLSQELIIGASPASSLSDNPAFLNGAIGTKFKIVNGYPGSREITVAIERNEVQGACGLSYSSTFVARPDWFRDKIVKVLVQTHATGYPELNKAGVPLVGEFARNDEERAMLELYFSQTAFGRPFLVAPGVPAERVAALRKAFQDTLRDPEFVADAERLKLDVDQVSGEQLQKLVERIYTASPELIGKIRQALVPKN